jgi:hypothetical protein
MITTPTRFSLDYTTSIILLSHQGLIFTIYIGGFMHGSCGDGRWQITWISSCMHPSQTLDFSLRTTANRLHCHLGNALFLQASNLCAWLIGFVLGSDVYTGFSWSPNLCIHPTLHHAWKKKGHPQIFANWLLLRLDRICAASFAENEG